MDAKQLLILGASVLASSLSGRAAADGTQDPYVHTSAWLASKMSAFTSSSPAHLAVSQARRRNKESGAPTIIQTVISRSPGQRRRVLDCWQP